MTAQTITEFLAARLDEDEAAARSAGAGRWSCDIRGRVVDDSADDHRDYVVVYDEGAPTEAQAAHIARHDPARVLREVAVKRAILEDHPIQPANEPGEHDFGCARCYFDRDEGTYGMGYCTTLKALAAVYSDHPDYREQWGPE